ncbi:hypothetical protein C8R45DRAFT_369947 [Mycena sanguinolenta]|nr:hypothetical protein C8R45DRAFT_369947 [Mycena sanguinolenta]
MDTRLRRVNKEIADCKNDKTSGIRIDLIDSSSFHLKGSFPVLTLKSTLISLQSLLCSPEPNDPQDAKHYTTSKRSFEETASYCDAAWGGWGKRGGEQGCEGEG